MSREHSDKDKTEVRSEPCAQLWKGPGKEKLSAEVWSTPTQPRGLGRVGAKRVRGAEGREA